MVFLAGVGLISVRIPIAADASAVTQAFDQIRAAIQRAGQEGRAFSQLDFSHPEMKALETEIRKAQANFEDLRKVARGSTAQTVRRGGANNFLDWYGARERMVPDPVGLQRHTAVAGRYILAGTGMGAAPPPGPPAPPPGGIWGAGAEDGAPIGGVEGAVSGALGKLGPMLAGMFAVSKIVGMATKDEGLAEQEATATSGLMRHLRDVNVGFDELRKGARAAARGLQITGTQASQYADMWTRLTNERDTGRAFDAVRGVVGFARGQGIDAGDAMHSFGAAAYRGEDQRRFAMLIAGAVQAGGQTGQTSEVMHAILRWIETSSRQMITGDSSRAFAEYMAGMNASGEPGLKGAAGEAILKQMDASVMAGGSAGLAGQAFMMRAYGGAGIRDVYEQQFLRQGGLFASQRGMEGSGSATTNYEIFRGEFDAETKGMGEFERYSMFANLFGLTSPQARAMLNPHLAPRDVGQAGTYLGGLGIDFNKMDPSAIGELTNLVAAPAGDLDQFKKRLLDRRGLDNRPVIDDTERAKLNGLSGDDLRAEIARQIAKSGFEKTPAEQAQEALTTKLQSEIDVGSGLITSMNELRHVEEALNKTVSKVTDQLDSWVGWLDTSSHGMGPGWNPLHPPADATKEKVQNDAASAARVNAGKAVLEQSRKYFLSQGWTPEQTAGMLSNEASESSFDPAANNGTHAGLFQWDAARQAMFAEVMGVDLAHSTVAQQLEFAQWELTHTEKRAGDALKRTSTSYDAGKAVSVDYERAPGGMLTGMYRGERAAQYMTPLPASDKAGGQMTHTVAPLSGSLHIVVQTPDGAHLGEDHLPITSGAASSPWGGTSAYPWQ